MVKVIHTDTLVGHSLTSLKAADKKVKATEEKLKLYICEFKDTEAVLRERKKRHIKAVVNLIRF
jgi:hypothetical protein